MLVLNATRTLICLNYLSKVYAVLLEHENKKLYVISKIIEVDDSFFSKKNYANCVCSQQLVLARMCHENDECFFAHDDSRFFLILLNSKISI